MKKLISITIPNNNESAIGFLHKLKAYIIHRYILY